MHTLCTFLSASARCLCHPSRSQWTCVEDDNSVSQGRELPCMESRPGCTPQLVHGKQAKGGPRCECVCQFSLCCTKHMHAMHNNPGSKKHKIYQYWKIRQILPLTSMVKRHHAASLVEAYDFPPCSPPWWPCCQHWHIQPCWRLHSGTCVCHCSVTVAQKVSLNQYVDPASR